MSALFLKIVNMSISAGWFVLAVLVLRLALKKAPKWVMVALWGLVAVRLLCPVSIESGLSLIPEKVSSGALVTDWTDSYIGDTSSIYEDSVYYDAAVGAGRKPVLDENGRYYVVTKYDQLGEPDTVENTVVPVLSVVWLTGVLAMLLYTAVSYFRLRRKIFTAVRLRENIYQSEAVHSPFVLGFFAPKIYLPFGLEPGDMAHVIAHEQAHIRRRDHWWKPFGFLLLTGHWFNPLLWLAYVLLCRDIELACDEKVIRELEHDARADYSQALLTCAVDRRLIAACPLAFGEVGVKERVKSVLTYKKPAFWFVVLAVAACVAAGVCFLTDPAGRDLENITAQKGYAITDQRDVELTLTIPKAALPDSIYLPGGHEFGPGEVVVYEDGTTTIWLEQVLPNPEEEEDWSRFFFNCSYDLPESGRVLLPYRMTAEGYYQTGGFLRSEVLRVDGKDYGEAVLECGIGDEKRFACYLSEKACRTAQDELEIQIYLNELSYEKLPRNLRGAFGRITGYGISTDPTSGRETYHIRVEDMELDCTYKQLEDVRVYMGYIHDGLIEDSFVYVTYDQFLVSKNRGTLEEIRFPETDLSFSPSDLGNAVIGGDSFTVPVVTVETKRVYVFKEGEWGRSTVTLEPDGTFWFSFSSISSYLGYGIYEEENGRLTLRTDDGKYVYVFDVADEAIIFDAQASDGFLWWSGLYDGAVMKREETSEPIITVEGKRVYTFPSEDPMKEKELILYEDGTCYYRTPMMVYVRSTPQERGTYEEKDGRLAVHMGNRIYVFWVTDDSIIFDRKASNGSGGLEDGAVLLGRTVPVSNRAAVEALFEAWESYPEYGDDFSAQLLEYGDDTLYYIAREFLAGGRTGERGEMMQKVFVALLGGEAIKYEPRNGQDYFDNWLLSAKNMAYQNGETYVRENAPKTWIILDDMISYFDDPEPVHTGIAIMALSEEEIAQVNEAFAPILPDGQVNPLSCFFTSYYDSILYMDFVAFMEYFPGGEEVTQEEFEELWQVAGFPYKEVTDVTKMPVPIHKYPVKPVRAFLEKYAGPKSVEVMNSDTQRGLMELHEYGAFYNFTSDMGAGTFYCTHGEREGHVLRLYEESDHGTDLLTLRKQGEDWVFVSHQHLEE